MSPALLALYRDGTMTRDTLMAFAGLARGCTCLNLRIIDPSRRQRPGIDDSPAGKALA